ncbi:MAG: hypothetical protein HC913_22015 [Microscillaceae bacterium]|nr:hypothetical protein [Microscillaceae bacterium]
MLAGIALQALAARAQKKSDSFVLKMVFPDAGVFTLPETTFQCTQAETLPTSLQRILFPFSHKKTYASQGRLVLHNPHKQSRQGVLKWQGLNGIALIPELGGDTIFSGYYVPRVKLSLQGREGYWHHLATVVQLPPQSTLSFKVWLIKDQEGPGSFQFFSESAWEKQRFWQNTLPGAYSGLMFTFFIGSLLFFWGNSDRAFLYLGLNTLLLGLFPLFLYGHTIHLTGQHYLNYLFSFAISQVASVFEIGLIRKSLHTYRSPYLHYDRALLLLRACACSRSWPGFGFLP